MENKISGLTLFALALSMLSISLNAFKMAGIIYPYWLLYFLGVIAGIAVIVLFIMIFLKKR